MKKILAVTLLSLVALLTIGTNASATNGMRLIGFGPVQDSMGGVSVGVPLDSAVVVTNPAGMSSLSGRLDFGASYFRPNVEYKATESSGMGGMVIGANDKTVSSDRGGSPIPAFGAIIPVNDRINFGIGAYGLCGMGVDYASNLYGGITYTSYSMLRFAPGLSYKINDKLSVGGTLHVMYATMSFNAAGGFGQQPHMNAESYGFGGTLGVLYKPLDLLQVGLAYETKSYFQDFTFNTASGKDKLEFNQPQNATLGFGIRPTPALLVGVDLQWIRWSETNGKNLPGFSLNNSGAMPWDMDWENQLVYKFGVQYTVNPTLNLRAGYNYGKMPLNANRAFENIAFPAIAEHHFTAGVGINLTKHVTLNLGGMYAPQAKLTGSNAGSPFPPTPSGQGIANYETKMSQYSLDMGLSYVF